MRPYSSPSSPLRPPKRPNQPDLPPVSFSSVPAAVFRSTPPPDFENRPHTPPYRAIPSTSATTSATASLELDKVCLELEIERIKLDLEDLYLKLGRVQRALAAVREGVVFSELDEGRDGGGGEDGDQKRKREKNIHEHGSWNGSETIMKSVEDEGDQISSPVRQGTVDEDKGKGKGKVKVKVEEVEEDDEGEKQ
ncbi:MAG: hypothetical protein M1817_002944 [Caeruleum heppii]|nr:MAG: hypothetical protein M1817_002944 [Caeruleum heppii]